MIITIYNCHTTSPLKWFNDKWSGSRRCRVGLIDVPVIDVIIRCVLIFYYRTARRVSDSAMHRDSRQQKQPQLPIKSSITWCASDGGFVANHPRFLLIFTVHVVVQLFHTPKRDDPLHLHTLFVLWAHSLTTEWPHQYYLDRAINYRDSWNLSTCSGQVIVFIIASFPNRSTAPRLLIHSL